MNDIGDRRGLLDSFEDWEDDVRARYPEENGEQSKPAADYRNFDQPARETVREFYRLNHTHQTLEFAREKRDEYGALERQRMGIWEAMEYLNTLVDDSDPDTDLSQIEHLLQTAESIRANGLPKWFVLTGLVHDLGKILCLWGEPQWAVVGDTFPLGCKFSEKVVYPEFFVANADWGDPTYQTETGVYERGGGLEQVTMSWGHDEYMYTVAKDYLPDEALYMIRYHSFYAAHREGAYSHLMNDHDRDMFAWVRRFSRHDLYSKTPERPIVEKLLPYYQELISEYFPARICW
jgi:inositol oxygenase